MLLHVFHVDTGTMIKFDVGLALDTVSNLKVEIEKKCSIPCEKQVLLASGGQSLEPTERVSTYFAGTDTSPIFLFSKSSIESQVLSIPSVDYGPDPDMKTEIGTALNLPATTNTVRVRSLLAQKLCDLAREQLRILDSLVLDQHLQQQGWAAVIANLDDITSLFKTRSESFEHNFKQHLETRQQYIEILDSFENDVETLNKIPVLPALLESELSDGVIIQSGGSVGEATDTGPASVVIRTDEGSISPSNFPTDDTPNVRQVTLLQWIASQDKQASLQQLAEQCRKGISQFDEKLVESLITEVESALNAATASDMREIKGLEDRLFGLDNLRHEASGIVREQADLSNAFIQNENSVTNLGGDESILPDLCMSHKQQLMVMLKNHQKLSDIRHRCVRAKQELTTNLFLRLRWVMFVQCKVFETDGRLLMHHENVKKLRRHLEILQQVHTAPTIYLCAVSEVVRRRAFSQAFLLWGSEVSSQVCSVHSEEVERRKEFHQTFQGHFLSSLFPGLDDMPPPFATHPPPLFDSNLPKLSLEDIESLRSQLPDLALSLSVPDLASVTQFFLSRSKADLAGQAAHAHSNIHDKIVEVVGATQLDGTLLQPTDNSQSSAQSATQPISDRGFESETDTEDLENITPSHEVPLVKKGRKRKEGGSVGTGVSGSMGEESKKMVTWWLSSATESVGRLKTDVTSLREWVLCQRSELLQMFASLSVSAHEHNQALAKEVEAKTKEIQALEDCVSELQANLQASISDKGNAIELARKVVEAAVRDKLAKKHKADMEAMRSRFRLMTSSQALERSTSESSLSSATEKPDYIERCEFEALIAQAKQEMEREKEAAIEATALMWRDKMNATQIQSDQRTQILANDLLRINNEKTREIEELRSRCETGAVCSTCGNAVSISTSMIVPHHQSQSISESAMDVTRPQSPAVVTSSSMGTSSVTIVSSVSTVHSTLGESTASGRLQQEGVGSTESSPRSSSRAKDKLE